MWREKYFSKSPKRTIIIKTYSYSNSDEMNRKKFRNAKSICQVSFEIYRNAIRTHIEVIMCVFIITIVVISWVDFFRSFYCFNCFLFRVHLQRLEGIINLLEKSLTWLLFFSSTSFLSPSILSDFCTTNIIFALKIFKCFTNTSRYGEKLPPDNISTFTQNNKKILSNTSRAPFIHTIKRTKKIKSFSDKRAKIKNFKCEKQQKKSDWKMIFTQTKKNQTKIKYEKNYIQQKEIERYTLLFVLNFFLSFQFLKTHFNYAHIHSTCKCIAKYPLVNDFCVDQ